MKTPKSTRLILGLSLAQMGERLGQVHPNPVYRGANGGHGGRAYHKQSVSQWENRGHQKKYRMTADTQHAYLRVVSEAVSAATNGRVFVAARLSHRVWTFTPLACCASCQKPFALTRYNQSRCQRCG